MAQECYIALLEKLGESEDLALVATICSQRIIDIVRQEKQLTTSEENRTKLVSADIPNIARQLIKIKSPDEGPISESELHAAVATLGDEDRPVIQATYVDGLTRKQTAELLNLTEDAVRWRQKRGIMALKKYFEVENGCI
jgi:RNA polymerase sigma factor (sigma-70 family)